MSKTLINTPPEIWLLVGDENELTDEGFDFNALDSESVCWWIDPQGDHDIRYIRTDIHESQLAELRERIAKVKTLREDLLNAPQRTDRFATPRRDALVRDMTLLRIIGILEGKEHG